MFRHKARVWKGLPPTLLANMQGRMARRLSGDILAQKFMHAESAAARTFLSLLEAASKRTSSEAVTYGSAMTMQPLHRASNAYMRIKWFYRFND